MTRYKKRSSWTWFRKLRLRAVPGLPSGSSAVSTSTLLGVVALAVTACRDWTEVANGWLTDVFGLAQEVF